MQTGGGERRGCGCTQTGREKIGAEIERDDVIREREGRRERGDRDEPKDPREFLRAAINPGLCNINNCVVFTGF